MYTVNGFQQEGIVKLGLDCIEVQILRWFVDFIASGLMEHIDADGERFYWIKYGYVIDQLPILKIKDKHAIAQRFDNMVSCGLMEKKYIKDRGNYTYFRIIPEVYRILITSNVEQNDEEGIYENIQGYLSNNTRGIYENIQGVSTKIDNKDSSNIYSNNNTIYNMGRRNKKPENQKREVFNKPTLEEIKEYCLERKNNVDPQAFIDHYDSNGWHVGKMPMKNWRAAIRTWEHNTHKEWGKTPNRTSQTNTTTGPARMVFRDGLICPVCGSPLIAGHTRCDKCGTRKDYGIEGAAIDKYYEKVEA